VTSSNQAKATAVETPPEAEAVVASLLPRLRSDRITYFPIRHHSPACAYHIRRFILEQRPVAVLVEGPMSFTSRIELLTDARCVCPVALFTNFIDKKGRLIHSNDQEIGVEAWPGHVLPDMGPARFAAYYPFCDYSPELVALRAGRVVGARLRFIDLEYGETILTQFLLRKELPKDLVLIESLTQDSHLRHSRYIKELAAQLGLRDFDEVWDHLFEAGWKSLNTDAFIDRLATYCAMARLGYNEEELRLDGTLAREQCMAGCILDELEKGDGPILVVTGGFHTVALPDLIASQPKRPQPVDFADDEVGVWLMRYSFDKLDSHSGYQSGMPSPAFYDRLWQLATETGDDADELCRQFERVAAEVLIEIAAETRKLNLPSLITTPDAIAAASMTQQLAAMRGHPWPMREDILDGVRSCFVKGELTVEGQLLLRLVRDVLAGNRVGKLPEGSDLPPIVADFHREARRFRIPIDRVEKKEYALELYRNATHRALSRFFHRLSLLGAPFGRFVDGPDFVTGTRLELMQERWETAWTPMVESSLIEASIYGTTIEEAAASRLKEAIESLEDEGAGRSTASAVKLLIRACRLGLHGQAKLLVPLVDIHIVEDPQLASVVQGLSQLELLHEARDPLEASYLTALPDLMAAAYQRACRLLYDAARCPEDSVDDVIRSLQMLREFVANAEEEVFDRELYDRGLAAIVATPPHEARSAVVGAAAGILYGEGRIGDEEIIGVVCGYFGGAIDDPRKVTGIIRGLLATACEVAWQLTEIMQALDEQFQSWDEKTFLELLPELRLAFASLTPRDVARIAEKISDLHQGESLGDLVHVELDEGDVQFGLKLNERVQDVLKSDGFTS